MLSVRDAERAAVERELSLSGNRSERVDLIGADADSAVALATAAGAAVTSGAEHLLILQSPGWRLTHDWLAAARRYAAQPGIAAAGPVVLGRDGRIADAGVALPGGIALHLLHGSRTSMDDFFGFGTSVHNVSALSGALLTPASVTRSSAGSTQPCASSR